MTSVPGHGDAASALRAGIGGTSTRMLFLTPPDLAPFQVAADLPDRLEPECTGAPRRLSVNPSAAVRHHQLRKRPGAHGTAKTMRVRDGVHCHPGGLIRLRSGAAPHRAGPGSARHGALWGRADHDGLRARSSSPATMSSWPLRLVGWPGNPARRGSRTGEASRSGLTCCADCVRSVKSKAVPALGRGARRFRGGPHQAGRRRPLRRHRRSPGASRAAVEAGLRQALRQALPVPVVATPPARRCPHPARRRNR